MYVMKNNKMLSLKLVVCLYLFSLLASAKFIPKDQHDHMNMNLGDHLNLSDVIVSDIVPNLTNITFHMPEIGKEFMKNSKRNCPTNKSLVSTNDVRDMIDYIYKELSIDEQLKEAFNSQVIEIRDSYTKDLETFIDWFQYQPEHLKHVMESLSQVRMQLIEPNVKNIAKILETNSKLEELFKDKESQFGKLKVMVKKYNAMCSYNCEEKEDHHIFKREIQTDNICISLSDLHKKIEHGLNESMKNIQDNLILKLSTINKKYNESTDKIKTDHKDKALQIFGRTMYDILLLQDEYHHFNEKMNETSLEVDIYSIRKLNVELDDKLLQLNNIVNKYKEYCRNCVKVFFISRRRSKSNIQPDTISEEDDSSKVIDILINSKYNETANEIFSIWENMLNNLNELIEKAKTKSILDHLKPIQEDVVKVIQDERQELNKLKAIVSQSEINKIYELVQKSQNLLKSINETQKYVESLYLK